MMLVAFDVNAHLFKTEIPRCFYVKRFFYVRVKLAVPVLQLADLVMELISRGAQKDARFQKHFYSMIYAEVCDGCSRPV